MSTMAENIRMARKRAALTQSELAEKANVNINTVSRIERGEIPDPRPSTLRKLAEALEVEPRDLVGW